MAKVLIADDYVDIQVSWLDRLELDERSRRVPLLHIKGVGARTTPSYPPPRPDIWDDQLGSQARRLRESDISALRGESHLVSLELCDEDVDRVIVDVEDESPDLIADRIRHAVAVAQARAIAEMRDRSEGRLVPPMPVEPRAEADEAEEQDASSAITPLPRLYSTVPPPPQTQLDGNSLARAGTWLVATGLLLVLIGSIMLAAQAVLGLLALGGGLASLLVGGLTLALGLQRDH